MSAPILGLALPSAADARAKIAALRMRQRISALHPHITTTAAFVSANGKFTAPKIHPKWEEFVLVPMDLTHLQSTSSQIIDLGGHIGSHHPDLKVTVAQPIGPAPALLNIVDSRLRLATHRAHSQEIDALVLSAPDGGDKRGAAMLSRMSRLWSQHHHLPTRLATHGVQTRGIADVVTDLRREGRRHIAVGSLWVCEDSATREHDRRARAAGAEVVGAPVEDDAHWAAWAFQRYCSAALGMVASPEDSVPE